VLRAPSPGICVVLSDFFDPAWETGVRALLGRRFQVVLLQILDPQEVEPELVGDLRLVDAETGEAREISITPRIVAQYKQRLDAFCANLNDLANRHGMDYVAPRPTRPLKTCS
jgi:hypothetical protein